MYASGEQERIRWCCDEEEEDLAILLAQISFTRLDGGNLTLCDSEMNATLNTKNSTGLIYFLKTSHL